MKKIKNPYAGLEEQGYNCFACCPSNPFGLKMEFYEDGDDIVCLWNPHPNFQSWLNTLHGGIQSTLMDELGGWVVNPSYKPPVKLHTLPCAIAIPFLPVKTSHSKSVDASRK